MNFEEILKQNESVLADFSASWCGPCRMLKPVVEQFEKEFEGRVKVVCVDVDEQESLAAQYGIQVVPTLLYFEKGELKKRTSGYMDSDALKDWLELK